MPDSDSQQTQDDPLIDEVRAIRKAICDQFDNDVDGLCDYLQQQEKEHEGRLIQPTPKGPAD